MLSHKKQEYKRIEGENMLILSELLEQFYTERNHSYQTRLGYNNSIKHLEKVTNHKIDELIHIATSENRKVWTDTQLRQWLIDYRNYNYNNFKETTAKINMSRVKALFYHFNINIGPLPYFSTKQAMKSEIIDYEDLPNREMLKRAIEVKNPVLKALTLFMSSTGLSRIDTYNLKVQDYLDSTYEYHHSDNIYDAIRIMDKSEIGIIPTFKFRRRKTGEPYRTFASPESVKAINNYLLSRELLENTDKLFGVSFRYFNDLFKETNDLLGFGKINGYSRFSPQMLRSYHASQLAEAGMTDSLIDLLQGRKPVSIARRHYIRVKREKLKEEYIRCLPFLVVEDVEAIKSENDILREENKKLQSRQEKLDDLVRRIELLEKMD